MWRRTYLFLVLVRLWFALSSSYLHPDENFQGPEVIAGTYTLKGEAETYVRAYASRAAFRAPRSQKHLYTTHASLDICQIALT